MTVCVRLLAAMFLLVMTAGGTQCLAQPGDLFGTNPDPKILGAELMPGAVFVRVVPTVDPFYESVMYVSSEPVGDVLAYYQEQLEDVRRITFIEEGKRVWAWLLKDWIPIPEEENREDLAILDSSPNVTLRQFQPDLFAPLIELMGSRDEYKDRLTALESAKSIIRITYRKRENDPGFDKLQGVWRNVDRDLPEYRDSTISFNPDSSYVITLTDDNVAEMAKKMAGTKKYAGKSPESIAVDIRARNPEKGLFAIRRNTIDLATDSPVYSDEVKSGLIEIQGFMFSVQFINMPKMTFIRQREE